MISYEKEELYHSVENKEIISQLKKQISQCPWRQKFHIQPETGLLNDPNGFAFYRGEYHLFYQWFPLGPVHGIKYWYHVKSKDLVNWENIGVGIKPDHYYDNYGAYSGSGITHNGNLYLMYTGNHRDELMSRKPMQALAIMKPDGSIEKLPEPVIKKVPEGYTEHFRDPKVWRENENFYAVIGAQRQNKTGCVVLYHSLNLLNWTFLGEIETSLNNFGYMWECPDYFELNDQGVLVFSPQGLQPKGSKYQNIYQTGYLIGDVLDLEELKMSHGEFKELDHGFDFYAPQSMEDDRGRRILVGWMGLGEQAYPTDKFGWAHCLTLPRELKIINNHLYQIPVSELKSLRKDEQTFASTVTGVVDFSRGTHYELVCEFTQIQADEVGVNLRVGDGEKTVIKYMVDEQKIILDRSQAGEEVGLEYGTTREIPFNQESLKLQIFMDTSSIEVFINGGEYVMTSRIFPRNNANTIQVFTTNGSTKVEMKKWDY